MSSRRFTPMRIVSLFVLVSLLALLGVGGFFGAKSYRAKRRSDSALAGIDARKPDARLAIRAADEASLGSGPLPIAAAIHALAVRGRRGLGERLSPLPSTDVAALMGWVYQTHDVPEAMMEPQAADADAATDGDANVAEAPPLGPLDAHP